MKNNNTIVTALAGMIAGLILGGGGAALILRDRAGPAGYKVLAVLGVVEDGGRAASRQEAGMAAGAPVAPVVVQQPVVAPPVVVAPEPPPRLPEPQETPPTTAEVMAAVIASRPDMQALFQWAENTHDRMESGQIAQKDMNYGNVIGGLFGDILKRLKENTQTNEPAGFAVDAVRVVGIEKAVGQAGWTVDLVVKQRATGAVATGINALGFGELIQVLDNAGLPEQGRMVKENGIWVYIPNPRPVIVEQRW